MPITRGDDMPQLDVNTYLPQLVWLAITFFALYVIMSRLALPRVASILEDRQNHIARDLGEAAKLREEMAKTIATYEQVQADARARAHAISRQVREDTAAAIKHQRAEADQQIAAKMADAEKRIGRVRDAAVDHIGEIALDVTQAVVVHLLGKTIEGSELQPAINEALGK